MIPVAGVNNKTTPAHAKRCDTTITSQPTLAMPGIINVTTTCTMVNGQTLTY